MLRHKLLILSMLDGYKWPVPELSPKVETR